MHSVIVHAGGLEFDGVTEISHMCEDDVTHAADQILQLGAEAVVVAGVHATLNPWQELEFEKGLRRQLKSQAPGMKHGVATR
jgi:N-methylhydantoinase A/oxoprolinase/acetone carboxylase beta subunit